MQNAISRDTRVVATEGQVSCDLDREAAILNLESGVYYGLNAVGARIWHLIQEPRTVNELLGILLKEFEVSPERCEADLHELLRKLVAEGLVKIENEASA